MIIAVPGATPKPDAMPPARRAAPTGIPRYKTVVITWLAIYPVLTLILALFGDQLREMVLPLRTLVITAVLVPSAIYVLVPLLRRVLAAWITGAG